MLFLQEFHSPNGARFFLICHIYTSMYLYLQEARFARRPGDRFAHHRSVEFIAGHISRAPAPDNLRLTLRGLRPLSNTAQDMESPEGLAGCSGRASRSLCVRGPIPAGDFLDTAPACRSRRKWREPPAARTIGPRWPQMTRRDASWVSRSRRHILGHGIPLKSLQSCSGGFSADRAGQAHAPDDAALRRSDSELVCIAYIGPDSSTSYATALRFSASITANSRSVVTPSKTCSGPWGATSVKGLS